MSIALTKVCLADQQPLCGVYCIYCAARWEGNAFDLGELMQPRYVGGTNGSSITELEQAAADHHLQAAPLANMTGAMLRSSPYPVILHVKGSNLSTGYDHYILYLWSRDGMARIIDPMATATQMPMGELESLWDGVGLIVSGSWIDVPRVTGGVWQRCVLAFTALAGFGSLLICARAFAGHRPVRFSRLSVTRQSVGVICLAAVLGTVWQCVFRDGLLRNRDAVAAVREDHAFSFVPRLSVAEVTARSSEGASLIDARLKGDYDLGDIGRAISIPVNTSRAGISQIVQGVAKDSEIVIYCQSRDCPYSQIVATNLMMAGYRRISYFPGGWLDWQSAHPSPHLIK